MAYKRNAFVAEWKEILMVRDGNTFQSCRSRERISKASLIARRS